jgi:hypothetical protein
MCIKGVAVCILCNEKNYLCFLKEYSNKRHYETKHASQLSGTHGQFKEGQNNTASAKFIPKFRLADRRFLKF